MDAEEGGGGEDEPDDVDRWKEPPARASFLPEPEPEAQEVFLVIGLPAPAVDEGCRSAARAPKEDLFWFEEAAPPVDDPMDEVEDEEKDRLMEPPACGCLDPKLVVLAPLRGSLTTVHSSGFFAAGVEEELAAAAPPSLDRISDSLTAFNSSRRAT
jgi:hypothetical protein